MRDLEGIVIDQVNEGLKHNTTSGFLDSYQGVDHLLLMIPDWDTIHEIHDNIWVSLSKKKSPKWFPDELLKYPIFLGD